MMDFSWVQIKTHSHLVFQSFIVERCIFGEQNMAASLARVFANEYSNHFPSGVSNAEAPGHLSCRRKKTSTRTWGHPTHISSMGRARARGGDGPAELERVGLT